MKSIKIWRWEDAPLKYRKLSTNGGDEDYIALLPIGFDVDKFTFLWPGHFGNFVDEYKTNNGTVLISSHA